MWVEAGWRGVVGAFERGGGKGRGKGVWVG